MLGWLSTRRQNARVTRCVKEDKWELENVNVTRRATILALAKFLRPNFSGEGALPLAAISHPFSHNRMELRAFYAGLEKVRYRNQLAMRTSIRNERLTTCSSGF